MNMIGHDYKTENIHFTILTKVLEGANNYFFVDVLFEQVLPAIYSTGPEKYLILLYETFAAGLRKFGMHFTNVGIGSWGHEPWQRSAPTLYFEDKFYRALDVQSNYFIKKKFVFFNRLHLSREFGKPGNSELQQVSGFAEHLRQ